MFIPTKMANYNEELNALFDKWEKSYSKEEIPLFCRDGLLLKAPSLKIDVGSLWSKAKRRVAFVLEENQSGEKDEFGNIIAGGHDIRKWLYKPEVQSLRKTFLQRIAELLEALLYLTDDNSRKGTYSFQNVHDNMELKKKVFNTEPFAFIEAKKLVGTPDSYNSDILEYYMKRDMDYLKEELEILKPNIIVCCGSDDVQFNFITEHYFPKIDDSNKMEYEHPGRYFKQKCCRWVYPEQKAIILKSYHPSVRRRVEASAIFERVISPFHGFLKNNPNFFESLE